MNLRLDWCSHEAALYAVTRWHYSRCLPNQKLVRIGVWEDARFVGVVVFGDGANPGMFSPYGLTYEQGAELVRIALQSSHRAPVSRLVAIALRFVQQRCPGLRLVVSFADPEHGHHGGIYQAGNWIYTGMTTPADEYLVKGVRMHGRALRSTRSTHAAKTVPASNILEWTRKVLDPKAIRVAGTAKHRYLMPLDAPLRLRLQSLAKPYPKRERSRDNAAAPPSAEGGVNPTRSLHSHAT
jgi:hypothetical protein